MRKFSLLIFFLFLVNTYYTQDLTQTIRGTVVDEQSEFPLPGATIILLGTDPVVGVYSDENGKFKLENVPIGRQSIQISFIGYSPVTLNNLILTSAKELIINVKLKEMVVQTEEFVVTAEKDKKEVNNEMATVSSRSFTVEETKRYAGTLNDPSRMVANYAGVAVAGDQRNDIIIRGNSPLGVLWRMDGINIPNTNHFGSLGTTGGPISILNNNVLDNSDFMTSAFPAAYGNALAGAFDLRMRNGNNEKTEFTGQVGFNGFEFGAEGPISKKKSSSYLAAYRYSTLGFLDKLGIDFNVGGTPQYQDLAVKVDFPGVKYGRFSFYAVGGLSYIELLQKNKKESDWSFGVGKSDAYYGSNTGFSGLSHTYFFNEKTRIKTNIAVSGTQNTITIDSLSSLDDKPFMIYDNNSYEIKYSANTELNKKINSKNTVSLGLIMDLYDFRYVDSTFENTFYRTITNTSGNTSLLQSYLQWQHKFTDILVLNAGVHHQHFAYNNSYTIEPRLGLKYQFHEKQTLSLGGGLHSQTQPFSLYFYETYLPDGSTIKTNTDLGFSKSVHSVIAYDYSINTNLRLKVESYYQYLYNIPVESRSSTFSALNIGADFGIPAIDSLQNSGEGENYGLEITFEKFFSKHTYFLITGSLYESKYIASDNIERQTAFSGNYTFNALGGLEYPVGKKQNNVFAIDIKTVFAGGRRYIPINEELSRLYGRTVYIYSQAYQKRYPDYFRFDIRFTYKLNLKRATQEWAINVQNVFDSQNIFTQTFDKVSGEVVTEYQMGFFPIMQYRILF